MKMKRSFKPGSQQREGAQFPLGFAHRCWWHRCWHQCAVSILHWQVQRQTPGEGKSAICPKSHTLGSSPGLPLASPGCLSPAGREKEKTNVFGDAARCQVMPWGHSCTIWLHIFCGGHFLYPFVGLESCLPFWLCFEHYLPAFLPSLVSCLPWREATLDSQAGFCHCKFQTAFNRNYRHLSWCVFFFFPSHQGLGTAIISCLSSITFPHIFCIFLQNHFAGTTERSSEIIWWLLQIQPLTLQALRDENCLKSTVVHPICTSGLLSQGENANRGDI